MKRTGQGTGPDLMYALCGTTAMKAEMIRQLPDRRALVIRGGMSPVITRLPMAWNDPAYRKARRESWATELATTPEPRRSQAPDPP